METEEKEETEEKLSDKHKLILGIIVGIIVIIVGVSQSETKNSSKTLSDVQWSEVGAIYGCNSQATDLQKENSWSKFDNLKVRWTGKVAAVDKTLGVVSVQVIMSPPSNTISRDGMSYSSPLISHSQPEVLLVVQDNEEQKASRLNQSQYITFEGVLYDWNNDNSVTVSEGVIIDN